MTTKKGYVNQIKTLLAHKLGRPWGGVVFYEQDVLAAAAINDYWITLYRNYGNILLVAGYDALDRYMNNEED